MKAIDLDPAQLQIELKVMEVEDCMSSDPDVRMASYERRLAQHIRLYMDALEDHVYFRSYTDSALAVGERVPDCRAERLVNWRKTPAPAPASESNQPLCGLCRACGILAQDNLINARQGLATLFDLIASMRAGKRLNARDRRIQEALDGTGDYGPYTTHDQYEENHELED